MQDSRPNREHSAQNRVGWPLPLVVNLFVTIAFTILTLLYALINYFRGLPHPYSWPFYIQGANLQNPHGDRFGDLMGFEARFHAFHTASFFSKTYGDPFPYPAPMALFYRLFLLHVPHVLRIILPAFALILLIPSLILVKRLIVNGLDRNKAVTFVALSIMFSGIVPFELRQLNAEIFVFAILAGTLYFYLDGKVSAAAILLGIAIALKLYPFMLMGLFFSARRYRAMFVSLLSCAITLAIGFLFEAGSFMQAVRSTLAGMGWFTAHFVQRIDGAIGWDHSIFAFLKFLLRDRYDSFAPLLTIYTPIVGVIGLTLYLLRIYRLPVFNQIASLMILMILTPPVSFEYTFLELYSVFAIFCCVVVRNSKQRMNGTPLILMGACFGFLFAMQSMVIVDNQILDGQTKCPVLLLLLILVLTYPVPDNALDALSDRPLLEPPVVEVG
jgi:hypothetical protein